jgi:hypothetical protein
MPALAPVHLDGSLANTILLGPLSWDQLPCGARLELLVKSIDLRRQSVDQNCGHPELAPGGMGISDGSKCPSELVNQHGPCNRRPVGELGLRHDRRYSPEIVHRSPIGPGITWPGLCRSSERTCGRRERPWGIRLESSRPGGEHAGRFACIPLT